MPLRILDASIDVGEAGKKTGFLVGAPQKTRGSSPKVTRLRFRGELLRRFLVVTIDEPELDTLRIPRGIVLSGLRPCTRLTILVSDYACVSEREREREEEQVEREGRRGSECNDFGAGVFAF